MFRLRVLRTKGRTLAISAAIAAGGFDGLEDILLAVGSSGGDPQAHTWPYLLAATFAIAKFVIIIVLVVVLLAAAVSGWTTPAWLLEKLAADAKPTPKEQLDADEDAPEDSDGGAGNIQEMTVKDVGFEKDTGLCFSGGGVRAASLTLGSLQELERGPIRSRLGRRQEDHRRIGRRLHGRRLAARSRLPRRRLAGGRTPTVGLARKRSTSSATWATSPRPGPAAIAATSAHRSYRSRQSELNERLRSGASVWATIFVGFVANLLVIASALLLVVVAATVALDALVGITRRLRAQAGDRGPEELCGGADTVLATPGGVAGAGRPCSLPSGCW